MTKHAQSFQLPPPLWAEGRAGCRVAEQYPTLSSLRSIRRSIGLADVPHAADTVARHIARLRVLDKRIDRLPIICPHLGAVFSLYDRPLAFRLRVGSRHKWRPVLGAIIIAVRL